IPIRASDLASEAVIDRLPFQPGETVKALPPDGVVAIASEGPAGTGPNPNFPPRPLPLQVSDADVRLSWEGQIAPNVPEYVLWRQVDGWNLDVRLYFGTLHPDPATLAAAQEELNRLSLPSQRVGSQTLNVPGFQQGWTRHIDTAD